MRPVDWLSWPKALEELTFRGAGFDQAIDKARWPATLKRLTFGSGFNQPIDKVSLPLVTRDAPEGRVRGKGSTSAGVS